MKNIRRMIIGCLGMILAVSLPAFAQIAEPVQGAGSFLNGYWILNNVWTTSIVLLNPTGKDRDAIVLFYDDEERFLTCDVRRLTPHDMEIVRFPVLFRDLCAAFPDTCAGRSLAGFGGHVEIRSEPVDNSGKPGINGYVMLIGRGDATSSTSPLFVVDAALFQIEARDALRIAQCACPRLKTLRSPLEAVFCR